MMIKLKPWNEVLAIGKERKEEICDCVCGISDTMLPWGQMSTSRWRSGWICSK